MHGNTYSHKPLDPGTRMLMQVHVSKAWMKMVMEARESGQYLIRLEGSGWVSLRTHVHLRLMLAVPPAEGTSDGCQSAEETT